MRSVIFLILLVMISCTLSHALLSVIVDPATTLEALLVPPPNRPELLLCSCQPRLEVWGPECCMKDGQAQSQKAGPGQRSQRGAPPGQEQSYEEQDSHSPMPGEPEKV